VVPLASGSPDDSLENAMLWLLAGMVFLAVVWFVSKKTSLSNFASREPKWAQSLPFAGVILIVVHMAWLNVKPGATPVRVIKGALAPHESQMFVQMYERIDQFFEPYCRTGNVVLRFDGFSAADKRHRDTVGFVYFRGAYAVYPQRIFCGEETDVVNNAEDLLKIGFTPNAEWLVSHNIVAVVTYITTPELTAASPPGSLYPAREVLRVTRDENGRIGLLREPERNEASVAAPPPDYSGSDLAGAGFYTALVFALGYLILCLIWREKPHGFVETVGLSVALGLGTTGLILFCASLAGFKPSRELFLCVAVVVAGALVVLWRRKRLSHLKFCLSNFRRWEWWLLLPVGFLSYLLVSVGIDALMYGWMDWDGFAIWGLKAKVVAHDSLRSSPVYFKDATFRFSHPDYPLLLPFITSGFHAVTGHTCEHLESLSRPLVFTALGAITYSALRRKLRRSQSLLLVCVLLGIPAVVRWAGEGGADLLLALFHAASVFFLVKWLEGADWRDLLAAALFTAYAALTKAEGMALAAINGLVLLVFSLDGKARKSFLGVVWFAFAVAVLLMPWMLWSRNLPHTHEISASGLTSNLPELWQILRAFLAQLAGRNTAGWGAVWVLLVLAAALGWRGFLKKEILALWMLFTANLLLYALVLTTKSWVRNIGSVDALERLLLHTTPVAICLVGYHWAAATPADIIKVVKSRGGTMKKTESPALYRR
jgi:hypothetical protein